MSCRVLRACQAAATRRQDGRARSGPSGLVSTWAGLGLAPSHRQVDVDGTWDVGRVLQLALLCRARLPSPCCGRPVPLVGTSVRAPRSAEHACSGVQWRHRSVRILTDRGLRRALSARLTETTDHGQRNAPAPHAATQHCKKTYSYRTARAVGRAFWSKLQCTAPS